MTAADRGGATPPDAPQDQRPVDPARSMTLLTELMRAPLDPGYAAAAKRRQAAGGPSSVGRRSPLLIVTLVVIGLGLVVAAQTLRQPNGVRDEEKQRLISSIQDRQRQIGKDSRTITRTQGEITTLQNSALNNSASTQLTRRLTVLEREAGTVAVVGPGVRLSVNDAEGATTDADGDARTNSAQTGRVTSTDLQIIVNGLWEGGAEAISINGQRLTSQSAIRFAGEAILVNFRALQPPYVVSAIGGPDLSENFRSNPGGAYLRDLVAKYKVRESLTTQTRLSLPAAATVALSHATPESNSSGGS